MAIGRYFPEYFKINNDPIVMTIPMIVIIKFVKLLLKCIKNKTTQTTKKAIKVYQVKLNLP